MGKPSWKKESQEGNYYVQTPTLGDSLGIKDIQILYPIFRGTPDTIAQVSKRNPNIAENETSAPWTYKLTSNGATATRNSEVRQAAPDRVRFVRDAINSGLVPYKVPGWRQYINSLW